MRQSVKLELQQQFNPHPTMTDLNEKLKLVAEYDEWLFDVDLILDNGSFHIPKKGCWTKGNKSSLYIHQFEYATSYDWQIPVWQKVCKESIDIEKSTDDLKQFMLFKEKYCKFICYGTPLESFEILVQAIQFINKMKK